MKKWLSMLLAAAMLFLTACSFLPWNRQEETVQTISFYFVATGDDTYETGALYPEQRQLAAQDLTVEALLTQYWSGPRSDRAVQAIPAQLKLLDWELTEGLLTMYVTDHWQQQTLLEAQLSEACLVMTLTQLPEVERLCIRTQQDVENDDPGQIRRREDFLLFDQSAISDQIAVKLYFADASGRFLVPESRTHSTDTTAELAEFIVQSLLDGPQTKDALAPLPEGTNLLSAELAQGVCTVNFSEAFVTNSPGTHMQARLAVFSVVNSLTELAEVERVRILCVGRSITNYAGLDLSRSLVREETAIESANPSSSDLDVTLYLPCGEKLAPVPVTVRQSSGKSGAEAVLSTLLSFEPANGYENPIPDGTAMIGYTIRNGLCTVTFNNAFAQQDAGENQLELAVRSVAATLCSMTQINRVVVRVADSNLTTGLLGQELAPDADWFWK